MSSKFAVVLAATGLSLILVSISYGWLRLADYRFEDALGLAAYTFVVGPIYAIVLGVVVSLTVVRWPVLRRHEVFCDRRFASLLSGVLSAMIVVCTIPGREEVYFFVLACAFVALAATFFLGGNPLE